ncbi:unnamed protein product [Rhizopus stolonifer]
MNTVLKYALKQVIGNDTQPTKRQEMILKEEKQGYWWNRRPKAASPLTAEEQRVLKKIKSRAHYLDRGISCCCFQIGLDGLVGFIPVIGDFIGVLLALQLIYMATPLDLPAEVIYKMMMNVVFDFVIGLVPLVGDVLDIMYKCNTKNAILLENFLLERRLSTIPKDTPEPSIKKIK